MSDHSQQIQRLLIDSTPVWTSRTTSNAKNFWAHLQDMITFLSVRRRQLVSKHFITVLKNAHKRGYVSEADVLELQKEVSDIRENVAKKSPGYHDDSTFVWLDVVPQKVRDKYAEFVTLFYNNEDALQAAKVSNPDLVAKIGEKYTKISNTGYATLSEIAEMKRMLKSLIVFHRKERSAPSRRSVHGCVDGIISFACQTYRGRKFVEIKGKRVFIE